jgi:hypothetical protein
VFSVQVDILLANEPAASKLVRNKFELPISISSDSVVVWRFSTAYFDIGFSMSLNGTVILPYQRYPTCVEAVKGSIYVPNEGDLELCWDNTYAKFRNKYLTYTVRVLSKSSFDTAKAVAQQAEIDRSMYIKHRNVLKKYLLQASKNLLTLSVKSTPDGSTPASPSSSSASSASATASSLKNQSSNLQSTGLPEITMRSNSVSASMNISLGFSSIKETSTLEVEDYVVQHNLQGTSHEADVNYGESGDLITRYSSITNDGEENDGDPDNYGRTSIMKQRSSNNFGSSNKDGGNGKGNNGGSSTFYNRKTMDLIDKLEDEKRSLVNALQSAEQILTEEKKMNEQLLKSLETSEEDKDFLAKENSMLKLRVESLLLYSTVDNSSNDSTHNVESEQDTPSSDIPVQVAAASSVVETLEMDEPQPSVEAVTEDPNAAIIDALNTRILALQQRNSLLEDSIFSAKAELDSFRQTQDAAVSKLKQEKKVLKDFANKLKGELEASREQIKALEGRCQLQEQQLSSPPYSLSVTVGNRPGFANEELSENSSFVLSPPSTDEVERHYSPALVSSQASVPTTAPKKSLLVDDETDRDSDAAPVTVPTSRKRMSMLGEEEVGSHRAEESSSGTAVNDEPNFLMKLPPTPSEIDLNAAAQASLGYGAGMTNVVIPPATPVPSEASTENVVYYSAASPDPSSILASGASNIGPRASIVSKPIISDQTVEMVDDIILETSVAAQQAISSFWEFGKSLVNTNNASSSTKSKQFAPATYEF